MKLRTQKEIEDMASNTSLHLVTNPTKATVADAWEEGYKQAEQDLLESASEGFEEWLKNSLGMDILTNDNMTEYVNAKKAWQAAKLSSAKELKKLEDDWEKAATQNYSDKTTIEDLQKENEELRKQRDIALNDLASEAKENQEMRDVISESLNSVLIIGNLFNRVLITRRMNIQINELLHEMNYKFLKVKTKGISETPKGSKEGV